MAMKYDFVIFTEITDTILVTKAIGAYKIAYTLRKQGYTVLVVDHLRSFNLEEFKKIIDLSVGSNTKFVGFSSTFFMSVTDPVPDQPTEYSYITTLNNHVFPQGREYEDEAVKHIKKINPDCKILAGGVKAHKNIKNRNVDYAILGYGETSALNLANHLDHGEPLKYGAAKNLWGVTVIDNALAPDYVFGDTDFRWEDSDLLANDKVLPIELSRGCIFRCRFCSYPLIGKKENDHVRTAESLRKELQDNYDRFGVEHYFILDDTFNDNDTKLDRILEAVKKLSFKPKFWAYIRLDLLTKRKDIDKLYDIGIRAMYHGIETIHPEAAKAIAKAGKRSNHIDMIRAVREKYGNEINIHGSFIVGLPGESEEEVTNTFNRLMSEDIPLHSFRFEFLTIYRPSSVVWSSEFSRDYEKWGYRVEPEENDDMLGMQWTSDLMDRKKATELQQRFNREYENSDRAQMMGMFGFSLLNYGYKLEDLFSMKFNQLPWAEIERGKKVKFLNDYKDNLFDYLDQESV